MKKDIFKDDDDMMSALWQKESGLPVMVWLDDMSSYKWRCVSHKKMRIKFQKNNKKEPAITDFIPMTIENNPVILTENTDDFEISDFEIEEIRQWVIANKDNLIKLANQEIDLIDFYKVMKKLK